MATRWGILGVSNMAHDFITAIELLPTTEHQVIAVASRDISRSDRFAKQFGIPNVYNSYLSLAKDPDVDVVYISNYNEHHYCSTKLMLENGKNVLCEIPFCQNAEQVKELVELARTNKLFLMEAMLMFFTPSFKILIDEIKKMTIGEPLYIMSSFGIPLPEHAIQVRNAGGSVLEFGIFSVYLSQILFGPNKPEIHGVCGEKTDKGYDKNASVILKYDNNKISYFGTNYSVHLPKEAIIFGQKGNIKLHNPFWAADKITIKTREIDIDMPATNRSTKIKNNVQLIHEIKEVRKCLINGDLESRQLPWSLSISNAIILDDIRKTLGVVIDSE